MANGGKRIFEGGERKEREREKEREGVERHIKTESTNWEEDKRTKFGVGAVKPSAWVPGDKGQQRGREAGCIQASWPSDLSLVLSKIP